MRTRIARDRRLRIPRAWLWLYTIATLLAIAVVAHLAISTGAAIGTAFAIVSLGFAALSVFSTRRRGNHVVRFRTNWRGLVGIFARFVFIPVLTYGAALLAVACWDAWSVLAIVPTVFGACVAFLFGVFAADANEFRLSPAIATLGILWSGVLLAHGFGSPWPAALALGALGAYGYRAPLRSWHTRM